MKTRGWIATIVGLVVCLAGAYGAYTLASYSWAQVVEYPSPYVVQELPAGEDPVAGVANGMPKAPPTLTVYVIIDGLRVDASRTMTSLNTLRAHGFDAVLRTSQPSLSFPNWTTLLSGAPQRISGVTTNYYEGRVHVETLFDTALSAGRTVAVSAPTDFEELYGVNRTGHVFLRDWVEDAYMTGGIVDNAIRLAQETSASLLVVHMPDVDEAGHAFGGASPQYAETVAKVDTDLGRLVAALQGAGTTFVVTADHGHIDTGGHGGPEDVVTLVPAVFAGPRVRPGTGEGTQDQVAPTVALLADLPAPRNATGAPLDVETPPGSHAARFMAQQVAAYRAYLLAVTGPSPELEKMTFYQSPQARSMFEDATAARLSRERSERAPIALGLAALCLLAVAAVGILSWRALVAAISGTAVYYAVYSTFYFLVYGYRWSLSSINAEPLLKGYIYGRMTDAIIAGLLGALVAAYVYLSLRADPKRAKGAYLPGWLGLGVSTVMVIQATIGVQVAWYLWYWGASVNWYLPDLAMGFKYDLDLTQMTGLGAAAILAPVVTYLVGRYHPSRRPRAATEAAHG